MIGLDTPLTEVAALLPTESADLLLETDPEIQTLVLTELRMVLVKWERAGVNLDPITFAALVSPVVEQFVIDNQVIRLWAPK